MVFLNLIIEVMAYNHTGSQLVRSNSQGEGITEVGECQEMGITEDHLLKLSTIVHIKFVNFLSDFICISFIDIKIMLLYY